MSAVAPASVACEVQPLDVVEVTAHKYSSHRGSAVLVLKALRLLSAFSFVLGNPQPVQSVFTPAREELQLYRCKACRELISNSSFGTLPAPSEVFHCLITPPTLACVCGERLGTVDGTQYWLDSEQVVTEAVPYIRPQLFSESEAASQATHQALQSHQQVLNTATASLREFGTRLSAAERQLDVAAVVLTRMRR